MAYPWASWRTSVVHWQARAFHLGYWGPCGLGSPQHLGQPGQAWDGHVTREKLDPSDIFDRAADGATVHCGQGPNGSLEELVLCAPKENLQPKRSHLETLEQGKVWG